MVPMACHPECAKKGAVNPTINHGRPNIIMIVVDDMRWDEFSAAGHPYLSTPHIDRLAREGAVFANAYHAVPLCSPNRASILTGQYPSRHGIIDNVARDQASYTLRLFAIELQRAGYETAHVGKWHMGNNPTPRPGYDYWACLPGQGRIVDPVLYENGRLQMVPGYVTDVLTDKAIEFISRKRDKPFFLYLGHKAIHQDARQLDDGTVDLKYGSQFIPADRHRGIYDNAIFPRRKNALHSYEQIDEGTVIGRTLSIKNSPEVREKFGRILDHFAAEETIRRRAEMLLAVDEGLGKLLNELARLNILENTFILFTSDNGYFYGEHGLSVERRLPYEESVKTPLIIRYPDLVKKGTNREEFVVSIDYAPTVLALAGTEIGPHIQGRSLLPLFRGTVGDWRESFLIEYHSYENPFPWLIDTDYRVLRSGRYKYIHWVRHEGRNELYDIDADPYELNNLIHHDSLRDVKRRMEREMARAIARSVGVTAH
jgi:N-acetylglucosamine-6-sulfatase